MAGPVIPRALAARQQQQPQWEPEPYVDPNVELRRQLMARMEALGKQQMYSPEEQDRREDMNNAEYNQGLLAQLSGNEQLQGAGGQVLKQAMADRQAKVTERGSYDPIRGIWTYNPDYKQDKVQAQLDRADAGTAASRERYDTNVRDIRARAAAREDQQAFQGQMHRESMAAAGATRGAAQDARNATIEDRMADDFNRDTKTQQAVLTAHKNLQAIAQKTDAPSDVAFIYSYMKMLDPTSVVRENEFATAQNAAGVPDRVRNAFNAAMTGQRLNPQQRGEMLATAGRLGAEAQSHIASTAQQYAAKAQRRALNAENVTGVPAGAAAAPGGGGGPAKQQPVRVNY